MSQVLEEVKKAIDLLGLSSEVHQVERDGQAVYDSLIKTFVKGGERR